MKQYLISGAIVLAMLFAPLAAAAFTPFLSGQVGNGAVNGYVLQTTGQNSVAQWVSTTTLGISGGGGTVYLATTSPWTTGNLAQVASNGTVKSIATSSLGLLTTDVSEGSNLYFTNARALAQFIANLAATTSVSSITTLPSLALPASQITGTLGVAHGGTGSTTLTGVLKGNGTSQVGTAVGDTDYQKPITLTTTGTSGAATFSGDTLNIPQYSGGGGSGTVGTGSTGQVPYYAAGGTTLTATSSLFINADQSVVFGGSKLFSSTTQVMYLPNQTTLNGSFVVGNGGQSLSHTSGSDGQANTLVGIDAGHALTIGTQNLLIGQEAGFKLTTASNDFAVGYHALHESVTGHDDLAIGIFALTNVTGNFNLGFGYNAGGAITGGSANVAIGHEAMLNTDASNNTAVGFGALHFGSNGNGNTAVGKEPLSQGNNTASVAIGQEAGAGTGGGITNSNNVFIGYQAASALATGANNNTILGYQAGQNLAGSANVFIGYQAGQNEAGSNKLYIANSSTASPLVYGDFNIGLLSINGRLGVGTTTTKADFQAATSSSNATTSVQFGKANQNKGTCLTYYDAAGTPVYGFFPVGSIVMTYTSTKPSGCQN